MAAIGIIPARLGSTRLPGKVLLRETGKPLIQHVYESARGAASLDRLVVATDDPVVAEAARGFDAEAVLTSPDHPNGTSRLAEACDVLRIDDPGAIIVNVQGDEPELDPWLIDAMVLALVRAGAGVEVASVGAPFGPDENPGDPNVVKVVRRVDGTALYFSRALVPFHRDVGEPAHPDARPLRHVGLYAFRRGFLRTYRGLAPTPLEVTEKLEQLRILEHGYEIAVALASPRWPGGGIDTREQYEAFVRRNSAGRRA